MHGGSYMVHAIYIAPSKASSKLPKRTELYTLKSDALAKDVAVYVYIVYQNTN